jgi:DNA-binding XRE family transcriptional regulator
VGAVNVNGRRKNTEAFGKVPEVKGHVTCPRCNGVGHIAPESISIGDRFKQQRTKLGLTQHELAPKITISRAQLANIEGDRSRPSIENFVKAADTFGVSVDYLLGRK